MLEIIKNSTYKDLAVIDKNKEIIFLDTCFLLDLAEKNKLEDITNLSNKFNFYMLSFNLYELHHIFKHLKSNLKINIRRFLKEDNIKFLDINIMPGNPVKEREFVNKIDNKLLEEVSDPSDAVLIATAKLFKKPMVLTRDKHHLFNTKLENYLDHVKVYKELKDIL